MVTKANPETALGNSGESLASLSDCVDLDRIAPLLASFSDSTGIAAGIVDLQGTPVLQANWQPICTEFHRQHPETRGGCIDSGASAAARIRGGEQISIYTCPRGLIDAVAPIVIDGQHLANVFVGQFLLAEPNLEHWRRQAARWGFEEAAYLAAVRQVPVVAEEKARSALAFLSAATELLGQMGLEALQREQTEVELRDSEARYRSLFKDSPVAMWEEDHSAVKAFVEELLASGIEDIADYLLTHTEKYERCVRLARVLGINRAAVELYGAASAEELIERADEIDLQVETREIRKFWAAMAGGQTSATYEDSTLSLAGRRINVRETCLVAPGHEQTFDRVYIADMDITERKRAEAEVARLDRLLRTVSRINQGIVRQNEPTALLSDACRTFVEEGGFCMSWIGLCDPATKTLTPVAWAGEGTDYVKDIAVRYDDSPEGCGPGGVAIKTGKPVVCRDTETDPTFAPFREAARAHGYRSLAALPIGSDKHVRGAIGLYVTQSVDWSDEEIELLSELADDLGFALQALENAEARRRGEDALRASETRYRRMVETAAEGIATLDAELHITFVNEQFTRLLGYEAEELLGASLATVLFAEDAPSRAQLERWAKLHVGTGGRHEVAVRRKDGSPRWVHISAQPIIDERGVFGGALAMVTDIHDRKLAEGHAQRTLERLRLSTDAAVRTLAHTVEVRDPYTAGHQERVAELAVAIGRRLKLRPRTMTSLRIASLIHDLGKIAVPAEILAKPGALTQIEWNLIRRHPETACEILREMRFPGPVATIVRQHHERLDGSGYPEGLRGKKKIRVCARIIAVADVVEAMSSNRPYRPALGIDAALSEIEAGRGVLYDADAVDACLAVFREGFCFSTQA